LINPPLSVADHIQDGTEYAHPHFRLVSELGLHYHWCRVRVDPTHARYVQGWGLQVHGIWMWVLQTRPAIVSVPVSYHVRRNVGRVECNYCLFTLPPCVLSGIDNFGPHRPPTTTMHIMLAFSAKFESCPHPHGRSECGSDSPSDAECDSRDESFNLIFTLGSSGTLIAPLVIGTAPRTLTRLILHCAFEQCYYCTCHCTVAHTRTAFLAMWCYCQRE
jgi:hypothetical protein